MTELRVCTYAVIFVAGGRRLFGEFLRSEFSEENLLFWFACEDLREEQNSERVCEKAQQIFDDYVSILSPKEASNARSMNTMDCLMTSGMLKLNYNNRQYCCP